MNIDVMLPCRRDSEFLRKAVDSVLSQSHRDFRLVVLADDRDAPAVESYVRGLSGGDERVSFETLPAPAGGAAHPDPEAVVRAVTAEVFVIMGENDVMLPDYLATVVDGFTAIPSAAVMQVGTSAIDAHGVPVRALSDRVKSVAAPSVSGRTVLRGEQLMTSLMHGNWTYFPSLAWKTEWVRRIGFRPRAGAVRDLALLTDIITGGGTLIYDPTLAFLDRRVAPDATSDDPSGTDRRFAEEAEFFAGEADSFAARGWKRAERAARGHLTSRLDALAQLPAAAKAGRLGDSGRALLGHAFGWKK